MQGNLYECINTSVPRCRRAEQNLKAIRSDPIVSAGRRHACVELQHQQVCPLNGCCRSTRMKRAADGGDRRRLLFLADAWLLGRCATSIEAKRGNPVELGLLTRIFLGLLALLIALVEHFDLLELLKCLTEGGLGIVKLRAQFVG